MKAKLLAYLTKRLGPPRGTGPEYQFPCPACLERKGDESDKPKFGVNLDRAVGGCYRCEFSFRSWGALFRYLNRGSLKIEELQFTQGTPDLPRRKLRNAVRDLLVKRTVENPRAQLQSYALPAEFKLLVDVPEAQRARLPMSRPFRYLESRGVTEEQIEEWCIGYCMLGEYANRLIFPVIQHDDVVYFTNRYCGDHPLKSKNPPNHAGFHQRRTCLLNYDNCVGHPVVALAEGPFSGLAFKTIPALVLMGKVMSDEQLELVRELVPHGLQELVLSLDPGAGISSDAIERRVRSIVPKVTVLPLVDGDPDDLRDSLPELLAKRSVPSLASRVRHRMS